MKVTVNVECSPEEARAFLGLPDVRPMQEALMRDLEQRLRTGMQAMDPENLMRTWLPVSMQGAEQLQKMFWSQVQQTMAGVTQATTQAMNSFADQKPKD